MLETEILAIAEKPEKIAGIFAAGDQQYFFDTGVDESLDGVIHHRLIVDRQQVFVGDAG